MTDGSLQLARSVGRLGIDLLVVVAWTLLVTVLVLETGWPRWAFYLLLVTGVLAYVFVTAD